jgi:hypothetical protein
MGVIFPPDSFEKNKPLNDMEKARSNLVDK